MFGIHELVEKIGTSALELIYLGHFAATLILMWLKHLIILLGIFFPLSSLAQGGPGIYFLYVGMPSMLVAFIVFCIFHITRSPKTKRGEAVLHCFFSLWVWLFATAILIEREPELLFRYEERASIVFPLGLLFFSLIFSFHRWRSNHTKKSTEVR